MADQTPDWTTWIITTLFAAGSTMIGTIVFLAKLIESKYVTEVNLLNKAIARQDADMLAMKQKHEQCIELHHQAEVNFRVLKAQVEANAIMAASNTSKPNNPTS